MKFTSKPKYGNSVSAFTKIKNARGYIEKGNSLVTEWFLNDATRIATQK